MSSHLRRKAIKKGLSLNLMVVGCSGLGKSTFINTLVGQELIPRNQSSEDAPADNSLPSTVQFELHTADIEEDGIRITLNIVDTPGFGDAIDNSANFHQILRYIEEQYDEVLIEETRIKRNPKFQDNRIHCLLYFLAPTGHGLKALDIELMRSLGKRVNILPLIAKSDSLSSSEMHAYKKRIMEDIDRYHIPIYCFPYDPEHDDQETIQENTELRCMLPFSVIGAEDEYQVDGRSVLGRKYPWGIVEIENPRHCDFSKLSQVLLGSHLQDLKDVTHDELYEKYRTEKLSMEDKANMETSRELVENPDLREAVVKEVLYKEEMLKKEEEKFREMELKVQREIELKRRELLKKEQSLKEIEMRLASQPDLNRSVESLHDGSSRRSKSISSNPGVDG